MTERHILIVDDDDTLLEVLNEQLQLHAGFLTTTAGTAKECLDLAKTNCFDVILLGLVLPDMDGREALRLMRQNGVTSPIMLLIGANTDADTILGLDVGANNRITKPFRLGVLLARLRAHISQNDRSDDVIFSVGPYSFQPSNKILVRDIDQCKFHLTDKETAILRYLYKARNKAVCREVVHDSVCGYTANETTHTLETHVYRLRQKIEPDPSNVTIIITEPGGYRLEL